MGSGLSVFLGGRQGKWKDLTPSRKCPGVRMFDPDAIRRMAAQRKAWEAGELAEFRARQPEGKPEYRTLSGLEVQRVYTPEDVAETPFEDIGLPGQYPFTRGPYPTMYRGRLWTM